MSNGNAGVWIDHRKALIVVLLPGAVHTVVVTSQVEKHPERTGDSPLKGRYEARQVPSDDRRQRALTGALNRYYDAVAAALGGPESLLILGPGEAKLELRKRLQRRGAGGRIAAVEAADRLTDRQVVARVRAHYSAPRSVQPPKHGRPDAGLSRSTGRAAATARTRPAPKARAPRARPTAR